MTAMNTRFLASVSNLQEADVVARHGADIIDLKDPGSGVLGAVDPAIINGVVKQQRARRIDGGHQCISATIGDLPLRRSAIGAAIDMTAAAGVDIVKIGWFADRFDDDILQVLGGAAERGIYLVVVLFAEYGTQAGYLAAFAESGVAGVMLDTRDKTSGTLRDKLADDELAGFLATARRQGLACGLAGSLRRTDIAPLLAMEPDYLGFRGALCKGSERTAGLDGTAVESVRLLIKSRGVTRAEAS